MIAENELFDRNCQLLKSGGKVDGVLLAATLEHMTFGETQEILAASWQVLRDGGVIVIGDTPNRLSMRDFHTSYLPFFQMLPPDVRQHYAKFSPRAQFADEFPAGGSADLAEKLVRWGNGVSCHEFELALGPDIHANVLATGYEDPIVKMWPVLFEDTVLMMLFNRLLKIMAILPAS